MLRHVQLVRIYREQKKKTSGDTQPDHGSRIPANSNRKVMRQTGSESSKRQSFRSNSQNQERRNMNQSHASRKCYKCGESHNTSDCRHHSRVTCWSCGDTQPDHGSRITANSNRKVMRQTGSESSKRQFFRSNSQNQERRNMNQSHASRKCYKCGESHNTSDCRHHSRVTCWSCGLLGHKNTMCRK